MPKLHINAPDGKTLSIDVPENTDPSAYDSIVDDVVRDYTSKLPSEMGSFARGVMSGIPGATAAVAGIESIGDKTYEQARAELEKQKDADWETNPKSYGAGKATGIIGTGVVAPASIPSMGVMGALSGVDTAKDIGDMPLDAAKGGVAGLVLGHVTNKIGEDIVKPLANKVFPQMGKSLTASLAKDLTPEQVQEYLTRPGAINAADTPLSLAEKLGSAARGVTETSKRYSNEARQALRPDVIPLTAAMSGERSLATGLQSSRFQDTIRPIFDDAIAEFTQSGIAPTAEREAAINTLNSQYERLTQIAEANGGKISEPQLRGFIDAIQDTVNKNAWGDPSVAESQNALKALSSKLRATLEDSNKPYGELMAPSHESAGLSSDLQKHFGLEDFKPTDSTVPKIESALKENKVESSNLAQRLKDATGFDLISALQDAQTKAALSSGKPGGALNLLMTSLGYGAGKLTGLPGFGIVGAGLGRFAASGINGPAVAKRVLDTYLSANESYANSAVRPLIQKFGPILAKAAKAGGSQLAATHFVLSTSDTNYQQLLDHLENHSE